MSVYGSRTLHVDMEINDMKCLHNYVDVSLLLYPSANDH